MSDKVTEKKDAPSVPPATSSRREDTNPRRRRIGWPHLTVFVVAVTGLWAWNAAYLPSWSLPGSIISSTSTRPRLNPKTEHILSVINNSGTTLDEWIEYQSFFAWNKIFEQIGVPAGADEGLVIASPSTHEPDYFYTWTRDSAIVASTILQHFLYTGDTSAEANLRLYAASQATIQKICNPSGCFDGDAGGLGEPKFHVNGTAFTGSWGRPQRDGPALRAITLIDFANYLLDRGGKYDVAFVKKLLYEKELPAHSVIKADLEYVAKRWHESSFDLWEETDGYHFFTFMVSRTALEKGAQLARRLSDPHASAFYSTQASSITKKLQEFISPSSDHRGVILAAHNNKQWGRKGLDAAVLLGVLIGGSEGTQPFGPANESVLASVKAYVDSFRDVYRINHGEKVKPVATGRYAEDIYDGVATSEGNPWYLTTLSVSHVLSLAVAHFCNKKENIVVSEISAPFWRQFDENIAVGQVLRHSSKEWKRMIVAVDDWSDGFWKIVRKYGGPDGEFTEQYNRNTGTPQGARHLTWSYAAFVNAAHARSLAKEAMGTIVDRGAET